MITLQNAYIMSSPIEEAWKVFNDMDSLARCFPTMKAYEVVDENTINLILRIVLGAIPLENRVTVAVIKREAPTHLTAQGVSYSGDAFKRVASVDKDAASQITVDLFLESISPIETKISYDMRVEAFGSIKRIYEAILKSKRKKMESDFLANIRKTSNKEVKEIPDAMKQVI